LASDHASTYAAGSGKSVVLLWKGRNPVKISHTKVEPRPMLYVSARCAMEPASIAAQTASAFAILGKFMAAQHIAPTGAPLTIYRDLEGGQVTMHTGFPVDSSDLAKASGDVHAGSSPGGDVVETLHRGPYATMSDTYAALTAELQRRDVKLGPVSWEVYLGDPDKVGPDVLTTQIFMQISPEDAVKIAAG
jgi:effector-binding domain-containing protein